MPTELIIKLDSETSLKKTTAGWQIVSTRMDVDTKKFYPALITAIASCCFVGRLTIFDLARVFSPDVLSLQFCIDENPEATLTVICKSWIQGYIFATQHLEDKQYINDHIRDLRKLGNMVSPEVYSQDHYTHARQIWFTLNEACNQFRFLQK